MLSTADIQIIVDTCLSGGNSVLGYAENFPLGSGRPHGERWAG